MKSTHDFTEEQFDATKKWQALCDIYKIPFTTKIEGQPSLKDQLTTLAKKFNLPSSSPVWDQILLALSNRKQNNSLAQEALNNLKSKIGRPVFKDLTTGTRDLIGRFTAIFAAQEFAASSLHFYGHGVEMGKDPGELIKNPVGIDEFAFLQAQIINSLGAAHDIIQGLGAPTNEIRSAEIFVTESQKMINALIANNKYSAKTIKILEQYRDHTIPFLAEECIVNGTYLLFNSGKRDFDNVLTQITQVFEGAKNKKNSKTFDSMKLDKDIVAMKLAISLSDTRRSEIKSVLRKLESLSAIKYKDLDVLEKLLQSAGILKENEKLPDISDKDNQYVMEKLMQIEGFLLRLGQNVRMTAELAYSKNPERKKSINTIRMDTPVEISFESHLQPFLNSIVGDFGEAAFAKALGEINNLELSNLVTYYQLEVMINTHNFDFEGWERHAKNLMVMKDNIERLPEDEKNELTELIYFIAAKSPGHKVGQEIYEAMKNYRIELASNKLPANMGSLSNLDTNITEIIAANPHIIRNDISSSYTSPTHTRNNSYTRGRFYSDPNISFSPKSAAAAEKKLKQSDSNSKTTSHAFEFISPKPTRKSSLDSGPGNLPPVHPKSKPVAKGEKENIKLPPIMKADNTNLTFHKKKRSTAPDELPPIVDSGKNNKK
ncbi:MAG: hypothetical protein V4501_01030 [Pseudomonadota bacterium]